MDVASLAYRTDIGLLRLGDSLIEERADHLVVRTPTNPTFWWGNFVLLDGPGWPVADAVALFSQEFRDAAHLAIGVDGPQLSAGDLAPFAEAGYVVERSVALTTDSVVPPSRPALDVTLRRFASDADWAARVDLACAVNDDHPPLDYRVFATAKAAADRALCETTGGAWFGAFVEGRLVSQLGLVPLDEGLARYQSVETHPAYRNRGLAGALVHYAGSVGLTEFGSRTLVIVADPSYVACRVYQRAGFTITESAWEVTRGIGVPAAPVAG